MAALEGSLSRATVVDSTKAWSWLVSGAWIPLATRFALAVAVVLAALTLARVAAAAFRRLRVRAATGAPSIYIVEKLVSYGLVLTGGFLGLSVLGVNLTSLAVFFGAVGVGVGLGLQGVVREFVSGLVLIFDPLVNVGDYVEVEGRRGEILEIGPRASRIRTGDGLNVVVPNSKLIESAVVNWTLRGGTRRLHIPFSVAYGVDKDLVRTAVIAAAQGVAFTLPESDRHRTQVWLVGFGESALNFELVVWPSVDAIKRPASAHAAYSWAIEDALRGAGVEMPFAQLDLRLRSLFGREGPEALQALGLTPPQARPAAVPRSSTNDAADDLVAEASAAAEAPEPPTVPPASAAKA